MGIGVQVKDHYRNDKAEIILYSTEALNEEARFASDLIRQHALVIAKDGGEDSSGRQKLAEVTPAEIVQKSCDIAKLAFEEFRARGWTVAVPTPDEANDIMKQRADSEEYNKTKK